MVGDVNVFFYPVNDDDGDDAVSKDQQQSRVTQYDAEVTLMVAVSDARRCGYGSEILTGMLYFLHESRKELPPIRRILAKISEDNEASLRFFERENWTRIRLIQPWREVEFHHAWSDHHQQRLNALDFSTEPYSAQ